MDSECVWKVFSVEEVTPRFYFRKSGDIRCNNSHGRSLLMGMVVILLPEAIPEV
ncbi:MAG: hypothetical protein PWP32_429 [Methanothermobacter sp.]|jgi:hypothetical protein|nr:hypothetical protein [Methanothermobacter sp.]MDN5373664.1 hypothetical protein [Methanothermobacter sp.]